jgi:Cu-Zn family superoxide dismutase
MQILRSFLVLLISLAINGAYASIKIPIYRVEGVQQSKSIGTVQADDTIYGLLLTPHLYGLPAGVHGFHIHELPFCHHHAQGAGGHWDPLRTGQHQGPYEGNGHLGDLPVLIVNTQGQAILPVLAPRLKLAQIAGHALMIHAGSDNYSDIPVKLGGGGARLACGAIPYY